MQLRTLIVIGLSSILRAQTGSGEYGGPSVLSRGMSASVLAREQNVELRPYIGINGVCDSGLTGFTLGPSGKPPNQLACGAEAQVGVSGNHAWRKSQLSLSYNGNYRHYAHNSYYDSIDQVLSLGFAQRLSKRAELVFKESAGTFSRSYAQPTAFGFYDASAFASPNSVPFDNRVYYIQSAADFTYRPSARLSVNVGGGFDVVRYRARGLFGATVESARGDVAYRYSRFGTVGVAYEFEHVRFRNVFGQSDLHNFGMIYSLRLTRTWEMRAQAGATRVESLAFEVVPIDPVIAAITGQGAAVLAIYRLNYVPSIELSLTKRLPHGSLDFNYMRGVTPGNGVYLTSAQETAVVNYQYTGVRRWTFSATGGYNRLTSLLQTIGKYHSYEAGVRTTREIGKGLNAVVRFDERRFNTGFGNYRRDAYRATLGLTWSPGGVPLIFW